MEFWGDIGGKKFGALFEPSVPARTLPPPPPQYKIGLELRGGFSHGARAPTPPLQGWPGGGGGVDETSTLLTDSNKKKFMGGINCFLGGGGILGGGDFGGGPFCWGGGEFVGKWIQQLIRRNCWGGGACVTFGGHPT